MTSSTKTEGIPGHSIILTQNAPLIVWVGTGSGNFGHHPATQNVTLGEVKTHSAFLEHGICNELKVVGKV